MKSITITLPLPLRILSPNARAHWATKAKATKAARHHACAVATQAIGRQRPPGWLQASLGIKAYFPTRRWWDADNFAASLKAYGDGIADSGIIANDRGLWPERPQFFTDRNNPRLELTLTGEINPTQPTL